MIRRILVVEDDGDSRGAGVTRRSVIGFGAAEFLEKPVRPTELLNAVGIVT